MAMNAPAFMAAIFWKMDMDVSLNSGEVGVAYKCGKKVVHINLICRLPEVLLGSHFVLCSFRCFMFIMLSYFHFMDEARGGGEYLLESQKTQTCEWRKVVRAGQLH